VKLSTFCPNSLITLDHRIWVRQCCTGLLSRCRVSPSTEDQARQFPLPCPLHHHLSLYAPLRGEVHAFEATLVYDQRHKWVFPKLTVCFHVTTDRLVRQKIHSNAHNAAQHQSRIHLFSPKTPCNIAQIFFLESAGGGWGSLLGSPRTGGEGSPSQSRSRNATTP
jgi:hypothetical protein